MSRRPAHVKIEHERGVADRQQQGDDVGARADEIDLKTGSRQDDVQKGTSGEIVFDDEYSGSHFWVNRTGRIRLFAIVGDLYFDTLTELERRRLIERDLHEQHARVDRAR